MRKAQVASLSGLDRAPHTHAAIAGSGDRQMGRAARGNVIITAITRTDS